MRFRTPAEFQADAKKFKSVGREDSSADTTCRMSARSRLFKVRQISAGVLRSPTPPFAPPAGPHFFT